MNISRALASLAWFVALSMIPLLPACDTYEGGDDDSAAAGDDDDTTAGDDDTGQVTVVTVSAVSPSSGDPDGGYSASVYGANYTTADDTTITFGANIAAVQSCGTGLCTVTVPPSEETGSVTVTVTNSNGEGSLEDAFTYEVDTSTLTAGYAAITRLEYAYPDAYSPPPESYTSAAAGFFEPMEVDIYPDVYWGGLLPASGNCVQYDATTDLEQVNVTAYDAGESVSLTGPMTFEMPAEEHYYASAELDIEEYLPGAYTLEVEGGADVGYQQLEDAVQAPETFTISPALDPATMTAAQLNAGLSVTLNGSCTSAVMAVDIYYTGDPYLTYEESILCHYAAPQTLEVSASYLGDYPDVAAAIVRVECYDTTSTTMVGGSRLTGIGRSVISGVVAIQ